MKLLLLLTNNNAIECMKRSMRSVNVVKLVGTNSNWKKKIPLNSTSYINSLELKLNLELNNLEKRNERNVSRHSLNSNNLSPLTGEMYYR